MNGKSNMSKKYMQRILSILLLCTIVFLTGTVGVFAMDVSGASDYTVNGSGVITAYSGSGGNIIIPSEINGVAVTGIGDNVFLSNSSITGATIPNGVKSMGTWAFAGCKNLTSVTMPDGLTQIGIAAFSNCIKLNNVTIPDSVTSIGSSAFQSCTSLEGIAIPANAKAIASGTFYGCSGLTNVTIPSGIESIGENAFFRCTGLSNIVLPDTVKTIGKYAFIYCTGLTDVNLGNSVAIIGESAFQGCSKLTGITVPASVTGMGTFAFADCYALTRATMEDGMNSIGIGAFAGCPQLSDLKLSNTLTTIRQYAFANDKALTAVTIPDSVRTIEKTAFQECTGLTRVYFPDSIKNIYSYAFFKCSNLNAVYFYGDAPKLAGDLISGGKGYVFDNTAAGFTVYYLSGNTTFTNPWYGYPAATFTLPAPALSIYAEEPAGSAVNITFTDDKRWRGAITGIKVDSTLLDATQYTLSDGKITIGKGILTGVKSYTVTVTAAGYDDASVTLTMTDPDIWSEQNVQILNTSEAELMVRIGDIDNLNFGWPEGFNPFSGESTPVHSYPWKIEGSDASGTDRIMVISSYSDNGSNWIDGYTDTTFRPDNAVEPIDLEYDLQGVTVNKAILQMFVDDFQAPVWGADYRATINGERAPFIEDVINTLEQTGPIGELITLKVPDEFLPALQSGDVEIIIDDPTTGAGDGYAIDFVRLLINPTVSQNTGTIRGTIKNENGDPISGASIIAGGGLTACQSDSNGEFTLNGVSAGLVALQIEADGYLVMTTTLNLISGETKTADFVLKPAPVNGVKLNENSIKMIVGNAKQLFATVKPITAVNKNVIWTSENESVAVVDENGQVTARAAGTTFITVTTEDGGYTDTCEVNVSEVELVEPAVMLDASVIYDTRDAAYVDMRILGTFTEGTGYKIVEKGFISIKNPVEAPDGSFSLDTQGIAIVKVTNTKDGKAYRAIKTLYGNTFYVRGYVTYENTATGETSTVYSDDIVKAVKKSK